MLLRLLYKDSCLMKKIQGVTHIYQSQLSYNPIKMPAELLQEFNLPYQYLFPWLIPNMGYWELIKHSVFEFHLFFHALTCICTDTDTHPHTQRLAFKRRHHYLFSSSLKSLGSLTFFCTNILGYCFINTLCADRILVRLKREREKLL